MAPGVNTAFIREDSNQDYFAIAGTEVKQDYSVLEADTISEVEEISPIDFYSHDPRFNAGVKAFFSNADFDNTFNRRVEEIDYEQVLKTIGRVVRTCKKELLSMELI